MFSEKWIDKLSQGDLFFPFGSFCLQKETPSFSLEKETQWNIEEVQLRNESFNASSSFLKKKKEHLLKIHSVKRIIARFTEKICNLKTLAFYPNIS